MIKVKKKAKQQGGPIAKIPDKSMLGRESSPVRRCDNCAYSAVCSFRREGYECAFQQLIDNIRIETIEDVDKAQRELTTVLVERAAFASIMERLSGGLTDEAADSIDIALRALDDLKRPAQSEANTTTNILTQIFQGGKLPEMEVVNAEFSEVHTEKEK